MSEYFQESSIFAGRRSKPLPDLPSFDDDRTDPELALAMCRIRDSSLITMKQVGGTQRVHSAHWSELGAYEADPESDSLADILPLPKGATLRKIEPRFPNPFDITTLEYTFAVTVRDYEPDVRQVGETRFLPFCAARIIRILERDPSGWWAGEVDGQRGWFWHEFVTAMHTSVPRKDPFIGSSEVTAHERNRFRPGNQPHNGVDRDVRPSILDPVIQALSQLQFALNHKTGSDLRSMTSNIKASVYSVLDIDRSLNRENVLSALTDLTRLVEDLDPREVEIGGVSTNHTDMTLCYAHILFLLLRSFADFAILGRLRACFMSATEYHVWTSVPSSTISGHGIEPHALFNSVGSPGYSPYLNLARRDEDVGWTRGRTAVTLTTELSTRSNRLSRISEDEDEDASEDEDEDASEDEDEDASGDEDRLSEGEDDLYEDGEQDSHDQWEVGERSEVDNAANEENVDEGELNYNAAAAALAETSSRSTWASSSGTTWTSYGSIWFTRSLTVSSSNSSLQF